MPLSNSFDDLTVEKLTDELAALGYIADRGLATSLYISIKLGRPILLEGEVGVGKTELAKTVATLFGRSLIRLQCYEGIDTNQALYEWDYARQMLQIRAMSGASQGESSVDELFGPKFLIERPLLQAIRAGDQSVLLIDEVDRADDEFEAFLLEILSDFQISIPEIGTVKAASRPIVILTSNRTRELHDALKRRCLYNWIGFPAAAQELEIVQSRIPGISQALAEKVVAAVNTLRGMDLEKSPGVAETIDWVRSLDAIGADELTIDNAEQTLGAVIKGRDDLEFAHSNIAEIVTGL
jgi:MoxR-like ATPase